MFIFDVTHQALTGALQGASVRAGALAQNMANVNTAGYQRVDVDFHATLTDAVRRARMDGSKITPAFQVRTDTAATAVRADGNTVDVDQEGALVAQNALEYQGIAQLLGSRRRMLETAMRTQGA